MDFYLLFNTIEIHLDIFKKYAIKHNLKSLGIGTGLFSFHKMQVACK